MRESFIFYNSFLEAIEELDDKKQLKLYKAIANFALKNEEPEKLTGIEKAIFALIKPQILANNKRFEDGKKGAEFGKLGGRPKKTKTPVGFSQKTPNVNENVNVNVNVNENVNQNVNQNENENVIDIFCGDEVEKVFQTYQKKCPDLLPLTFERKNREVRQLIADYLDETARNYSYFEAVCEKGNCLKEIAGKKIDLKMLIKNHIGINNGKYLNKESPPKKGLSEDYINDLFK